METQERFPQGLGNLATNARFPHSHKPRIILVGEEEELGYGNKVLPMYPVYSVTDVSGCTGMRDGQR
jgi:hypothetical protein